MLFPENKFPQEVCAELNCYVYIYSDPDTEEPFYIGKGKDNRCFEHLQDTSKSAKVNKINELKNNQKQPLIELIRYGLTEKEASLLEAVLIDYVGLDKLTNKVRGEHSRSFGRTTVKDIQEQFAAKEVTIDDTDKVLLIRINNSFYSKISESELYEVTRGIWKIGTRRDNVEYAFALFQGIVKEVYQVNSWHKAGTLEYVHRDSSSFYDLERCEFKGIVAAENIRNKYIGKSVRNYFFKGSQNPFKYINC